MAMNLRLSEEETEALRQTAAREGRSMQETAKAAIREYTERRTTRRNAIVERALAERAGAFDRLADA